MKKLITIPDEINDILQEYKDKTGIAVTAYIQEAIYRRMIHDKLMIIKTVTVHVDKEGKTESERKIEEPQGERFCDSDRCEII